VTKNLEPHKGKTVISRKLFAVLESAQRESLESAGEAAWRSNRSRLPISSASMGWPAQDPGQADREKAGARIERIEVTAGDVGPVSWFRRMESDRVILWWSLRGGSFMTCLCFRNYNVSLRGQCVGVMGPNGAGKSTLMKMLIGQE
jgi:ABC-type multidrug transport system fused ATPase/permease subunit